MTVAQDRAAIAAEIVHYLVENNPLVRGYGPLPTDKSLYELGLLDSAGVIELVVFVENLWSIEIQDTELTLEKFGSIEKMANLVFEKLEGQGA